MEIKFLLDTNIISEPLRSHPNPGVMSKLKTCVGTFAIASIIWHELLYGMERLPLSQKRQKIEYYLQHIVQATLPILPYDEVAAAWHAIERARLEKKGLTPAFADGQIASIAKKNGLTLITRNVRNFTHFEGLQVKNWFL